MSIHTVTNSFYKVLLVLLATTIGQAQIGQAQNLQVAENRSNIQTQNRAKFISLDIEDMPLDEALHLLARTAGVGLSYDANLLPDSSATFSFNIVKFIQALNELIVVLGLIVVVAPYDIDIEARL